MHEGFGARFFESEGDDTAMGGSSRHSRYIHMRASRRQSGHTYGLGGGQ